MRKSVARMEVKTSGSCLVAVAAMVMLLPGGAWANTTNSVPYAESFEGYAAGASVVGSGGWYSAETSAAVVVEESYSYSGALPIPGPHARILSISEPVSNLIGSAAGGLVYLDTMLSPRAWEEETPPTVPPEAQAAVYVNTNHHLVVWHRQYAFPDASTNLVWTELTDTYIASGQWFRITFEMNYRDLDFPAGGLTFYRIFLDGLVVSSPEGRSQPVFPSQPNGSWFPMANYDNKFMSGMTVAGTGKFDDLQAVNTNPNTATIYTIVAGVDNPNAAGIVPSGNVAVLASNDMSFTMFAKTGYSITNVLVDGTLIGATNAYTFYTVTANHAIQVLTKSEIAVTENGVPYAWLDRYGLATDMIDEEPDGMLTWEEYVMGTDPTNKDSVCKFMTIQRGPAGNTVTWYATRDSGVEEPFEMYRATATAGGKFQWQKVAENLQRPLTGGTNTWLDAAPPATGPVYYKPSVMWVTP